MSAGTDTVFDGSSFNNGSYFTFPWGPFIASGSFAFQLCDAGGCGGGFAPLANAQFSQQGPKLVATGAFGTAGQGYSVSLSGDGNTAIVGGPNDNLNTGAAWVWTRSGGVWTQQGPALVGSGAARAQQGYSVSLSANGNKAIVCGDIDNWDAGAAWVWTRSGGVWTQQGTKLVGSAAVGNAQQGGSVSLSADGTTAIVGGSADNGYAGAAWVFVAAEATISPSSHDFGNLNPGMISPVQTFTLTNNTADSLTPSASLSGPNSTEFQIRNDNCSGKAISPSGTCTVDVIFSPFSYGPKAATLAVVAGTSSVSAALTGTGGATGSSKVTGTVYNEKGNPFSGVSVKIGSFTRVTGADGRYTITNISAGAYTASVSSAGYSAITESLSIPPSSTVTKDFQLTPSSTAIAIKNISSKYPDNAFYLDGVENDVTFTVTVDWGGHAPGKIRVTTPKGTYDVLTNNNTVSSSFNMGTEFGPCGKLKVTAISSDGTASSAKTAEFTVMSAVPLVPGLRSIDIGNSFYYDAIAGFEISLFDQETDVLPEAIPLFGGKKLGLKLAPSAESRVTSAGTAEYTLDLEGKVTADVKMIGAEIGIAAGLDLDGGFSDTACKWNWGGYFTIASRSRLEKTWFIGLDIPIVGRVGAHATASVEGNIDARIGVVDITQINKNSFNGQLVFNPAVDGYIGADATRLLSVEGGIGGGVEAQFQWPQTPTMDAVFYLSGGVKVSSFGMTVWENNLLECRYSMSQGLQTCNFPFLANPSQIQFTPKPLERDYIRYSDYGKFAKGRTYQLKRGLYEGVQYTTATAELQSSVFPYSESDLSSSGTNLYLTWLYDNPDRTAINRTMAVFSSWNGAEWSDPQPIADDGTADFHPQILTFEDGTALSAWENMGQIMPDTATFDDVVGNLEIAASIYDPSTGQWLPQHLFTANNFFDGSPRIAGKTKDNVLLVWIENEANDLLGSASKPNKLYYSKWNGALWSAPAVADQIPYGIIKYDLGYDGQNGHVVMSLDTDNDGSTIDDHELYMITYNEGWGAITRLTQDSVADDNPQMAIDPNGNFVLTWVKGNELSSVLNFDMNHRTVIWQDEYSTNLADFKLASTIDGKLAIVWAKPSAYSSDLWAIFYDPIFAVWGSPKQLTFDPETERQVKAGFYGTDTLIAVYDRTVLTQTQITQPTLSGRSVIYSIPKPGTTDLYMMKYTMGDDLALQAGSLNSSPSNPDLGTNAVLTVKAMNLGDKPMSDVPVNFYLGDPASGGTIIGESIISQVFKPGDTTDVSIQWAIPQTATPLTIFAVIDPSANLDPINRANNTTSTKIVKPDLAVKSVSWEWLTGAMLSITARISNDGVIPSGATTVKFKKGSVTGQLLSNQNLGVLNKYQSKDVNFLWDVSNTPLSSYTVSIVVDKENVVDEFDKANNVETVAIGSGFGIAINGGAIATKTATVKLSLSASSNTTRMCISNTTSCTVWAAFASTKSWTLTSGDGAKPVYVWFKDQWGNKNATPYTDTIILDAKVPTNGIVTAIPGNKQVTVNWSGFNDAGSGIRRYKVVFAAGNAPTSCSTGTSVPGYNGISTTYSHTG